MTEYLLDTHTFIWLTEDDPSLSDSLRGIIERAYRVYLSIVSLWEIAIKLNIGKLTIKRPYQSIGLELEGSDILMLPVSFADTVQVRDLPLHHRDPFDRMLIAQAINRSLAVVSADKSFDSYAVERIWE